MIATQCRSRQSCQDIPVPFCDNVLHCHEFRYRFERGFLTIHNRESGGTANYTIDLASPTVDLNTPHLHHRLLAAQ